MKFFNPLSLNIRLRSGCQLAVTIFLASTGFICTSRAQSCVSPPAGIVNWWSGEGDATDRIGGDNGNIGGNTTFGPGEVGQAFVFDGTSSYIDMGNPPSLQLQNFTIEAWIKRFSSTASSLNTPDSELFCYGQGGYGFGLWNDGRLFLTATGVNNLAVNTGLTDTNKFHHVAVTKSGTTVLFYVDGVQFSSPAYNTTFVFNTSVAMGARGDNLFNSFFGAIDELAVYSRALSTAEVQGIYNAGMGGKCATVGIPTITAQPANKTVNAHGTASFSAAADGALPMGCQWSFNGTNIAGATNFILTLTNVQPAQSGPYSVVVSNLVGSTPSSSAQLTVIPPPPCTSAPSNIVGWWPGEGNAIDNVGGNNGNIGSNVTFGIGMVGQAFIFSSNSSSYIDLGTPANLQLQNFTIEAWVKRFSSTASSLTAPNAEIFCYGSGGYGFGLWNDGRLFLTKSEYDNIAVNTGFTDTNSFHHVAVTKSGTTVIFYMDGAAFTNAPYASTFTFSTPVSIGAEGGSQITSFYGAIDDLAVYSRALSATEIQAIFNAGGSGKCALTLPPSITAQPASQSAPFGGTATFHVGAMGSPPLIYQWSVNGSNIALATNATLTLTNVQPTIGSSYSVLVTNLFGPAPSSNATLTVNPVVQAVSVTATGGAATTVPINLVASGSENALEFSVNFSPSLLTYTGAALGNNASSGFISINTNGLPSGHLGLYIFLPFNATFPPGTQQVAQISFVAAMVTNSPVTTISFGDSPALRQISNPQAVTIAATYSNGTVSIPFLGYEGDLAPRTNGDTSLTLADWIQEGRFVAGLDTPTNGNEFLRADCAPRATLGDGLLTVADWVQVWRYATGADPVTQGGGPTQSAGHGSPNPSATRTITALNSTAQAGQSCQTSVQLNSQGNENALGFSVVFDPTRLTFTSAVAGSAAGSATFIVNSNQAAAGNIGIALELPSLSTFTAGAREVAKLNFAVSPYAAHTTVVAFTNQPVSQDAADASAASLPVSYFNGTLSISNSILVLGAAARTNGGLLLSWPASLAGFNLESNTNLASTNWTPVVSVLVTNGGTITTTNPVSSPRLFFRLHHP